jgi:hypothetical protein
MLPVLFYGDDDAGWRGRLYFYRGFMNYDPQIARRNPACIYYWDANDIGIQLQDWCPSHDISSLRNMQCHVSRISGALGSVGLNNRLASNSLGFIRQISGSISLILHTVGEVFRPIGLRLHVCGEVLSPGGLISGSDSQVMSIGAARMYFPPLEIANDSQNQREKGDGNRGQGGAARRLVRDCLWLLFGFALTCLAHYAMDKPNPKWAARFHGLFFYPCVAACVYHGLALFSL